MRAYYRKHELVFKKPGGTSRGVLHTKETWFLILENNLKFGIGECALLRGLSVDDVPDYEEKLQWLCQNITLSQATLLTHLQKYPSLQFGLETALLSLHSQESPFVLFPSKFTP
jgi:o-succinylbenzoate synthase